MSTATRRWVLGIDTGGTYTDAVLYSEHPNTLLAKAKAPTTHENLGVGIGEAISRVLAAGSLDPSHISFVALSTTLATNALVEGRGRRAALVMIGFEPAVVERGGLPDALKDNALVMVAGGHTSHGIEAAPLDREALTEAVIEVAPQVDAFAVAAEFSVRNADHELAARHLIRELTALPVTCSHELADALGGPKRSVTALLNARLIALVDELVESTTAVLRGCGVVAPIMVVRGNGSLVSAAFVRERPVETILSGPAASLVGAVHLVGAKDALIADIGGTTTDLAALRDGCFDFDTKGARVGGHQTMVEAVAMSTHGLGGDSEVLLAPRARGAELLIGPRRVVPLVVAAQQHFQTMAAALARQLSAPTLPQEWSTVFVQVAQGSLDIPLDPLESKLVAKIKTESLRFTAQTMPSEPAARSEPEARGEPVPRGEPATPSESVPRGEPVLRGEPAAPSELVARGELVPRGELVLRGEPATPSELADTTFVAADLVVNGSREALALRRLVARGVLRLSAFTPTDAAHVLGIQTTHAPELACRAAEVWARRSDHQGKLIVASPREFAERVVARVVRFSAEHLLAKALQNDGLDERYARGELLAAALDASTHTCKLVAGLAVPLIGLGAPAANFYPAIGKLLNTNVVIPEHADVANAIGAAVGKVRLSRRVTVSSPRRGLFRVHSRGKPEPFVDRELARQAAISRASSAVAEAMVAAGAPKHELTVHWDEKSVDIGDRKLFVEGVATVVASGPPQADPAVQ